MALREGLYFVKSLIFQNVLGSGHSAKNKNDNDGTTLAMKLAGTNDFLFNRNVSAKKMVHLKYDCWPWLSPYEFYFVISKQRTKDGTEQI